MRFAVLVHPGGKAAYEAGAMPDPELLDRMGKFNEELVEAGVMQAGEGFHPSSKGLRIHFGPKGVSSVSPGPFADTAGLIGGFWIWQVAAEDEALYWAKRAPMEDGDVLELRRIFEAADFGPEAEEQEKALIEKMSRRGPAE